MNLVSKIKKRHLHDFITLVTFLISICRLFNVHITFEENIVPSILIATNLVRSTLNKRCCKRMKLPSAFLSRIKMQSQHRYP